MIECCIYETLPHKGLKLSYTQHFLFLKHVLDLWYDGYFNLQVWNGSENSKKARRLNKDEIKKHLIESMVNNDLVETDELKKKADKVEKPEDAAAVTKQYKDIIRTKKKKIIFIAYY